MTLTGRSDLPRSFSKLARHIASEKRGGEKGCCRGEEEALRCCAVTLRARLDPSEPTVIREIEEGQFPTGCRPR
jgi:hypothetical protein